MLNWVKLGRQVIGVTAVQLLYEIHVAGGFCEQSGPERLMMGNGTPCVRVT